MLKIQTFFFFEGPALRLHKHAMQSLARPPFPLSPVLLKLPSVSVAGLITRHLTVITDKWRVLRSRLMNLCVTVPTRAREGWGG